MTSKKIPAMPSGRRKSLNKQAIAMAAFEIIDSDGIQALSARRLAKHLNCEAMSIYHHIANMDRVLDEVVEQLLGMCVIPPLDSGNYKKQLIETSHAFLSLAERFPHVFLMAVSRPWVTPAAYTLMQASVQLFQFAGISPRMALRYARVLGAYLGGAGTALAGWKLSALNANQQDEQPLKRAVPGLRKSSTSNLVKADVTAGIKILVDGLLEQAAKDRKPKKGKTKKGSVSFN
jgi:TetR/AcrR family transcriptional regulator, tetracycline repressor protein